MPLTWSYWPPLWQQVSPYHAALYAHDGGKTDPARVLALLCLRLRHPEGCAVVRFSPPADGAGAAAFQPRARCAKLDMPSGSSSLRRGLDLGICTTSPVPGIGAPYWWLPWKSSAYTASSWNPSSMPRLMASTRRLRTFVSKGVSSM